MRQGLRMMKYVTNHPFDFANPGSAFFVALMQTLGGLAAEIACILFLGSINKAIDVIIKFVALASIAKVDDFYASALPADGNKIKKPTKKMMIKIHKRDWEAHANNRVTFEEGMPKDAMDNVGWSRKIGRFIFKFLRVLYGSWIFYFLPYSTLFLPYVAQVMRSYNHTDEVTAVWMSGLCLQLNRSHKVFNEPLTKSSWNTYRST